MWWDMPGYTISTYIKNWFTGFYPSAVWFVEHSENICDNSGSHFSHLRRSQPIMLLHGDSSSPIKKRDFTCTVPPLLVPKNQAPTAKTFEIDSTWNTKTSLDVRLDNVCSEARRWTFRSCPLSGSIALRAITWHTQPSNSCEAICDEGHVIWPRLDIQNKLSSASAG